MDRLEVSVIKIDKLVTQIDDIRDILNGISGAYDANNQNQTDLRLKVSVFLDELIADYMTEIKVVKEQILENEDKLARLKMKVNLKTV